MPKKRFTVEQIINHLREASVLLAQGTHTAHSVTIATSMIVAV